jgi:hypothetical protein
MADIRDSALTASSSLDGDEPVRQRTDDYVRRRGLPRSRIPGDNVRAMHRTALWVSVVLATACVGGPAAPRGPTSAAPTSDQPTSPVELVARFGDATGLPVGTRVVIAGLDLGRVTRLDPESRGTLVWFELRKEPELWSNATLTKKASSTLGEHYLELDPGTTGGDRLGPRCPGYASSVREEARRCREVTTVVEAVTPEGLIQRIDQTLPRAP